MQAVDSKNLSLEDFQRRAGFSSNERTVSRDAARAIKTVYWAFGLCHETGIYKPYGLERRFEPGAFRKNAKGDPYRLNKWTGYLKGRHEPRCVLALVQDAYPRANDCLRSPIWPALAAGPLTRGQLGKLLLRLEIPIQELITQHGLWPGKLGTSRKLIDEKFAAALERRACLDALGAVVLLLRLARAESDHEAAYRWGKWLWRMLVLLGPLLAHREVALALADLIEERIMPMADLEGMRFGFPPGHYMTVVAEFTKARALAVHRHHPATPVPDWKWHSIGQGLFEYESGWDYRFAFNPVRLIDKNAWLLGLSKPALSEARLEQHGRWCHDWALNMLSRGRHPAEPPRAVWMGHDLWAVDPKVQVTLALTTREERRCSR